MATVFVSCSCCSLWFLRNWWVFRKGDLDSSQHAAASVGLQVAVLKHTLSSHCTACAVLHERPPRNTNEGFFQLCLSCYLPSSLSLHLHLILSLSFSYRSLCIHIHLFFVLGCSYFLSFSPVYLFPSLPLSLFELRAVSRSELCSHLSHH